MPKPSNQRIVMPAVSFLAIGVVAVAMWGSSSHFRAQHAGAVSKIAADSKTPVFPQEESGRVRSILSAVPLAFEDNEGQTDSTVKYIARGNGYTVFLTGSETVFALSSRAPSPVGPKRRLLALRSPRNEDTAKRKDARIGMQLVGANTSPRIVAGKQLAGVVNYYLGSDRANWHAGVKQFETVTYRDVYPGINVAFHGEQRQLEFDFVVAPGADAASIGMAFHGMSRMATDAEGNLVLGSSAGNVMLHKPLAYQMKDGARTPVDVAFELNHDNVGLKLGDYDHSRELVIDPTISYLTFLGGTGEDDLYAVALDSAGDAYVTGQTNSPTFPGSNLNIPTSSFSVFVSEVNPGATALVYTDIFSASADCSGNAIAVDAAGDAFVGGSAPAGFPTTTGVFQPAFSGGSGTDGFVVKLAATTGALAYSTYLGGSNIDVIEGIAVDGATPANAYVVGQTQSTDFPTVSPVQMSNVGGINGFVTKVNGTGAGLVYSTYLGGSNVGLATGIALDSSANAYVTGLTDASDFPTTTGVFQTTFGGTENAFVTEVKSDGSAWVYSTYLGGSGTDDAFGIAVDAAGEAYVAGSTTSKDFPTANAVQTALGANSATNIFVSKLAAGGTGLVFSTYYGGSQTDVGTGIALDAFGDAYVTGRTTSSNYPTVNAFQTALSGTSDALVTEFSSTGFVVYSSFLGGPGTENGVGGSDLNDAIGSIAIDASSDAFLGGNTASPGPTASTPGFPVTSGVLQSGNAGGTSDGFVGKITAAPADFSIAISPTTISTPSGQPTGNITVTVSSVNSSFGQAVALSCVGLPSDSACNFTPASVTPTNSAVTSTLTISTSGSSSAGMLMMNGNRKMQVFIALLFPVAGITLLGAGSGSRRRKIQSLIVLSIVLAALIALPACGGSSGSGGGGGGGSGNATPGNYTFAITGTAGSSSHSAMLTLTVQ